MSERIAIDETTSREELEMRLRDRLHALVEASPAMDLLLSWTVAGHGALLEKLRRGRWPPSCSGGSATILATARRPPGACRLTSRMSETLPPEWYEQETIRGDFLRAVRQLQMNPDEPLALDSYLAEAHVAGTLAAAGGRGRQAGARPRAPRSGRAGRRPVKRRGA